MILVDRKRAKSAHTAVHPVQHALQQRVAVVPFLEGTSSDGAMVLAFRSSLVEASVQALQPINPARFSYTLRGVQLDEMFATVRR
jgi:1-acyl-sn-glycerol-3-phosphate acyltransferase